MAKPKPVPSRLGPPPQLSQLHKSRMMMAPPTVMQQKFQPKMREILGKRAKLIMKWVNLNLTWKKILMSWMVVLVASKMVLLMLTYQYFTLTSLISLQIFHGVWTIAFFCLNVIESRAILPNASCLLAGYLPATTVLHILLIPNDFPIHFIILDAIGTFLAIITMFLMLRMECKEILHEAEEMWEGDRRMGGHLVNSETSSESGVSTSATSVRSGHSGKSSKHSQGLLLPQVHQNRGSINDDQYDASAYHQAGGRRIFGNPSGPTIITVNGIYDSMMFNGGGNNNENDSSNKNLLKNENVVVFDEGVDLEPIDFEHFVDLELEHDSNNNQNVRGDLWREPSQFQREMNRPFFYIQE